MSKKIVAMAVLATLSPVGPLCAAEALISNTKIAHIQPVVDGSFYVSFTTDDARCLNTVTPKRYYVRPGQKNATADGSKMILTTAMSALLTDRTVSIRFDDSDQDCSLTRILVTAG